MHADQEQLQREISARRQAKGLLKVWVLLACRNPRCPIVESNFWVEEQSGTNPFQAAGAVCWRCKQPLVFEGFES